MEYQVKPFCACTTSCMCGGIGHCFGCLAQWICVRGVLKTTKTSTGGDMHLQGPAQTGVKRPEGGAHKLYSPCPTAARRGGVLLCERGLSIGCC